MKSSYLFIAAGDDFNNNWMSLGCIDSVHCGQAEIMKKERIQKLLFNEVTDYPPISVLDSVISINK